MRILRVDLTQYGPAPELDRLLRQHGSVQTVARSERIEPAIRIHAPQVLCFEFDYPDVPRLRALRRIKQEHSALPVLMVTEYHSEALAVWALRAQVWDYFVKPLAADQVLQSLAALNRLRCRPRTDAPREVVAPAHAIPPDVRFWGRSGPERVVRAAMAHVVANLHERVTQCDLAVTCRMSRSQFSRTFKQVYGATFQDYLMRARMEAAVTMLSNPSASVTDVCWSVGFHDPSYFTRMFRRHMGVSPSRYRALLGERDERAAPRPLAEDRPAPASLSVPRQNGAAPPARASMR